MVQDQQNEVLFIGKIGGEVVVFCKEYEFISQLCMDVVKNGMKVDEVEIVFIKQKVVEFGKLIDVYNWLKFDYEIGQQFGLLGCMFRQN